MELEKFVIKALERGLRFGVQQNGHISFDQRKKLAELTKHIDYGCDFNSHGRCKCYRNRANEQYTMCCCGACFSSIGYLRNFPTGGRQADDRDRLRDLKVYARHFSEEVIKSPGSGDRPIGFWRPGKGCVLPRSHRSNTCLHYSCGRENSTEWEKKLFQLLNKHMLSFPVKIRRRKYSTYTSAIAAMTNWRKEIDGKDKGN